MSTNDSAALETAATDDSIDLEPRDVRALTQYLTVLDDVGRAAGADDLYAVVSESGEQYLVDARTGACDCPDATHRNPDGGCKHVRRVAFATGERTIPTWVDTADLDDQLGAHVDGAPRQAAADGGEIIVADDGGEILEEDADGEEDDVSTDGVDETDGRPDDCACAPFLADLPCWPCYREGFDTPAATEGDDA